ncbi:acyl-CoA synthetase (NDP forming) [Rhodoligotrophos appendicifer]|uniref:acetate--CoA ligase family protein n=1 Tax=Rhodoligotrophos appendicifer TaxID=987056 RepID=UPI001185DD46|nr:acetate--CoA ligase family protein [Rhodoligotrophos appendicifer]
MEARTGRALARQANIARLLAPRHLMFAGGIRNAEIINITRRAGYQGEIYVVHPQRAEIGGIRCTPSILDLPVVPDASFLTIPADATIAAIRDLSAMGAAAAVCYASGFSEIGGVGMARHAALIEAAGDMALVGPNCFGVVNYVTGASMWSAPYDHTAGPRGAAIIGQSGNVCIHFTQNQRQVPLSYVISAGNQAVLGFEDYIEFLIDDPNVTAIGLFLEGIRDVPAFSAACARAAERDMALVALRVGTSELGAQLAASHTSSLAGQNELYDALFDRLGIMQTASVPQFLELLKTASLWPKPKGRSLTVFSSSGGDNGMSADFFTTAGLELPPPDAAQIEAVEAILPDYGHCSNPLDFTAGYWGQENLLTPMFTEMMSRNYDQAVLVIDHGRLEPGAPVDPAHQAMVRSIGTAARVTGIPGAVASVNPESMPEPMRRMVIAEGLLPLQGLHDAGPVLGAWTEFAERSRTRRRIDLPFACAPLDPAGGHTLNERDSKRALAEFGLPIPPGRTATLATLAAAAASMAGPFVLKALHDDLAHKTEVGGVALNLSDAAAVLEAAQAMKSRVEAARPGLTLDEFLLEPMLTDAVAELIVGVKRDALFGLVLVIGAGGILVELMRDAERLLLPTTPEAVERAVRRLKSFTLLDGFRGRPKGDLAATVAAIMAVADYAAANRDTLLELDVNPLMVRPQGATAVDALIVKT